MIITFDFQISETELNDKVTAALKLDDTQSTVSIRATLAQEYVKASSDQTRVCEMLIHDQHLQVSIFIAISIIIVLRYKFSSD